MAITSFPGTTRGILPGGRIHGLGLCRGRSRGFRPDTWLQCVCRAWSSCAASFRWRYATLGPRMCRNGRCIVSHGPEKRYPWVRLPDGPRYASYARLLHITCSVAGIRAVHLLRCPPSMSGMTSFLAVSHASAWRRHGAILRPVDARATRVF